MSSGLPRSLDQLPPRHRAEAERQLGVAAQRLGAGEPKATPADVRREDAAVARPSLNKTERRARDILLARGYTPILEQAITLRLDPPFRSYRPDLAYVKGTFLTLVEVKARHRFMEKGIAKAALAAKTYPMFRFELMLWTDSGWKESVLSP